jgi:hypothetical protein
MKIKLKIALMTSFVTSFAGAADLDEGKSMYQEDCTKCHDSSVFTRPSKERKVNDFATLKKQVHRCVGATGASWFEEDEENVVAYLNKEFYKFAKAKEE